MIKESLKSLDIKEIEDFIESNPEILEKTTSNAPLRRIGMPDEIAGAAVFLASKAGAFTTGQNIVIDGGVTAS